jgi:hypothetical protein
VRQQMVGDRVALRALGVDDDDQVPVSAHPPRS